MKFGSRSGVLVALSLVLTLIPAVTAVAADSDLVINEVMQNPSAVGDAEGEWFEIHNTGTDPVDINGWTISDNDDDSHVISNGGPLLVPAGGYFVLGNNADTTTNGGVTVDYSYGGGFFLANGGDELVLTTAGSVEIDRIEWDGGPVWPDPNGASMSLDDPAVDNNIGTNWCEATTSFGNGDLGTPGAANDDCGTTPPPPPPADSDLVINEILQNPSAVSDGDGEWFEVVNTGDTAIDIDGWTIADNDFDSHVITNGGPLVIPADGFLVLGANADSAVNGGVTVDYQYSGIALANGADELVLLDTGLAEVDRVEWDDGATFPDPTGASMSLDDPLVDNNVGANWCEATSAFGDGDSGTPGATNDDCDAPPQPPVMVKIHEIQGSGSASPLAGTAVTIEGVVVGDFEGPSPAYRGFYVQEEDADVDGDTTTSEGIFVFNFDFDDVSVGDLVQVTSTVAEFGGQTQLGFPDSIVVVESGQGSLVTPTSITLPYASLAEQEQYEGMLLAFDQTLTISEYFNFDRFGEVVAALPSMGDRPYTPTAVVEPDAPAIALADLNVRSRISIDDLSTFQNPDVYVHPGNGLEYTLTNSFRGGDTIEGIIGVLNEGFGSYRLLPTTYGTYTGTTAPATAPDVGGDITVAAFNALNYFNTLTSAGSVCGPDNDLGCRGADDADERDRQLAKLVNTIVGMDADVVGLIEIENSTGVEAMVDIVGGVNDVVGAGTYDYIDTGTVGTDAIKVGFIYKPATVTPVGDFAVLEFSQDEFGMDRSRAALAQTFSENASGEVFTPVVNHLKSKSGSELDDSSGACTIDPTSSPQCDSGDGQAFFNAIRTDHAAELVDWIAGDPTGSNDSDHLIIGDLNSYDHEDPIDVIRAGLDDTPGTDDDFTDLLAAFQGELAYSFVFDGQFGYLDYGMSSAGLTPQVTGAAAWHINADEPDILDYNTTPFASPRQGELFDPASPFRSSDHDPVLIGLDLDGASVTIDPIDPLWPPNHKLVTVDVTGSEVDGDPLVVEITGVTSSEADSGLGEDDVPNDIQPVDDDTVNLRAERFSTDGRTYTISFRYLDRGVWLTATVLVVVPHDQRGRGGPGGR